MKRNLLKGWMLMLGLAASMMLYASPASAVATCTSIATGSWNTASTWSCVGTPAATVPTTTTPVVLASPYTVTLNTSVTVPTITINSGATLSDTNGNALTVTGDIINNGTFTSNQSAYIYSTGNTAIISGTGVFSGTARLATSGTTPSVAAGSNLNFVGSAQFRIGRNSSGNAVPGSTLTINGTITGTSQTGGTGSPFVRLYSTNTIVSSTGIINGGTSSAIVFYASGSVTMTNGGNVTIGTITRSQAAGTWTNAAGSSLTVRTSFVAASMTLNASAANNTVTYNTPATPIIPSSNTYYNLAGTGVVCPVSFIILGTSPCVSSLYVQGSPSNCTNVTGVGTIAWANPANAYTSNNVYATASNLAHSTTTNYLNCTGFNLAAPAGATILGITVYVERKTSGGTTLKDAYVYLIKGGTISTAYNGATSSLYTTTDTTETHGGQTQMWGTTWTPADVNASNFGVAFAAQNISTTSNTSYTVSVDQIQIRVDYTLPLLHHIRIEHDGAASTCAPEPITLKACSNAACSTYYTGGSVTNIGLSPTGGGYTWTPGSTVSITSGGISSGIVLAGTSNGTAALAITGSPSPTPGNAFECYNTATGASGGAGSAACNLVFSSNTFSFNVPDHTAAIPQTVTMTSCTSGFANQTRAVKFWSTYVNPATGTLSGKVVAGTGNADCTTGYASLGTSSGSPATLNLSFGAGTSPQATFSLCYPDVGAVRVDARYDGSAATGDAGVVILGNDNFIAKPDHFVLSGIKCTLTSAANCGAGARAMPVPGDNPAATDATGGSFIRSGDATSAFPETHFTATVTAKNALNVTTPNYGLESTSPGPEGVRLTVGSVVAPTGGSTGILTCKGSATDCVVPGGAVNFSNGATTITDMAWNEVGVITIMSKIADGNYLRGSFPDLTGEVATPTVSGNVGRFYPHHFDVTLDPSFPIENRSDLCGNGFLLSNGTVACGNAFTYMGENMMTNFVLTAQSASGTTTSNYAVSAAAAQNFAKLDPTASGNPLGFGAVDTTVPTYLNLRVNASPSGNAGFSGGVTDVAVPVTIARAASPDGPYAAMNIGIAPVDSDGVAMGTYDLDTDAIAGNDHTQIGNTEVRFGRLKLTNAYGSELLALPVPVVAQYWNGSAFVTNALDNETQLKAANIGLSNYLLNLTSGSTTATVGGTFAAGVGSLTLSPPGATKYGSVDLVVNLGATAAEAACIALTPDPLPGGADLGYLRGKWCGASYDRDPTARARFGVYKSPIIYMRENY